MSTRGGSEDVFVMRPGGSGVRNLTRTPDLEESHPAWSPSGELTFTRHSETGPIELWRIGADGKGARRLSTSAEPVFVFDWA
jgi:Tol biopolymer transport system component